MQNDIFRPRNQPARRIYDAFQDESRLRDSRSYDEWPILERQRVWEEARDYAQQNGLRVPTIKEIEQCEMSAMGHCDYGAKWAYGVADILAA